MPPLIAITPDGYFQLFRQGVDHRNADPVQTAGGFIRLAGKLAAGMQHGHDDFERRFAWVFGVWIDGDAAAVVADAQVSVPVQFHPDGLGVTSHGFIHGVIKHFSEQVVQRLFIGAADIHTRTLADRLQAFKHLDA